MIVLPLSAIFILKERMEDVCGRCDDKMEVELEDATFYSCRKRESAFTESCASCRRINLSLLFCLNSSSILLENRLDYLRIDQDVHCIH